MPRSTFKTLFYLNRSKIKRNGDCPIMGRITIDGEQIQFSTGLDIVPTLWNSSTYRVKGRTEETQKINKELHQIEDRIKSIYQQHWERDGYVSAERIKQELLCENKDKDCLLAQGWSFIEQMKERVGKTHTISTYRNYIVAYKHLEKFIQSKYQKEDVSFSFLTYQFIEDFDFFMKTQLRLGLNTIRGSIIFLRKMVSLALQRNIITTDPFWTFKTEKGQTDRRYLTEEELLHILQTSLSWKRANYIRHMFIFSCFTGLSRADITRLKREHIFTNNDGRQEIRIKREKTEVEAIIPLLPIAQTILKYYQDDIRTDDCIFQHIEKSTASIFTKTIAEACGIEKKLTFHMARHTFATTVCLANGVPIETLSKMLGHRSIATTQIYGKITDQKLAEDMHKLSISKENDYTKISALINKNMNVSPNLTTL